MGNTSTNANAREINTSGISVENGMLKFATVADYRGIVDDQDSASRAAWFNFVADQSFNSVYNTESGNDFFHTLKNDIASDLFQSILNTNGCVRISRFTCRLNPTKDTVYVLESENPTEDQMTALLAENSSHEEITAIPTNIEICEVINACENDCAPPTGTARIACLKLKQWFSNFFGGGGSGNPNGSGGGGGTPFCTAEGGIGSDSKEISPITSGSYTVEGGVRFKTLGLYYHLYAYFGVKYSPTFDFYLDIEKYYKVRCGWVTGPQTITGWGGSYVGSGSNTPASVKYTSYEGSVNLSRMHLKARVFARLSSAYAGVTSQWVEICKNDPNGCP